MVVFFFFPPKSQLLSPTLTVKKERCSRHTCYGGWDLQPPPSTSFFHSRDPGFQITTTPLFTTTTTTTNISKLTLHHHYHRLRPTPGWGRNIDGVIFASSSAAAGTTTNRDHQNPYAILGISVTASSAEIKRSYRLLAKKYHPDVCKDSKSGEVFMSIRHAYDVLSDEVTRAQYDFKVKNTGNHMRQKKRVESQELPRREVRCGRCGQLGHYRITCPNKIQGSKVKSTGNHMRQNKRVASQELPRRAVLCGRCGRSEHYRTTCQNKIRGCSRCGQSGHYRTTCGNRI